MKTKTKTTHLAFRLDEDALAVLDGLCEDIGSPGHPATRSRVLRAIIMQYVPDYDVFGGLDDKGHPTDRNKLRRDFIANRRKHDDWIIKQMADAFRQTGSPSARVLKAADSTM